MTGWNLSLTALLIGLTTFSVFTGQGWSADQAPNSVETSKMSRDLDAIQDILFCGPRRPFLIRLHLSVNGKGFRKSRVEWADRQFATLDVDKNGFLEGDELKRLPTPDLLNTNAVSESLTTLKADADPADGKVSAEECRHYLLAATGTPFSLQPQLNNNSQVNLFPKLDSNQDGKLSREEIQSAEAKLRRYDRNEDDIVTSQELSRSIADEQVATQQQLSGVLGKIIVVDSGNHILTSRRLLETYDKVSRDPVSKTFRKDERLSKSELPIESTDFDRADHNHDGKLDRFEMGQLANMMAPTVELVIESPSTTGVFRVDSLLAVDKELASTIDVKKHESGRCQLILNDAAFELSTAGPTPGVETQLRAYFEQLFKQMDQDNNDYLEIMEMRRFGFPETFFLQADTDSDKKIFNKEYQAQINQEIDLSKTSFALEIAGDGRSLFRLVDSSPADGRLTLRELADAPAKLSQWDANGDGDITLSELSIALNAVFRAGTPRVNGPNFGPNVISTITNQISGLLPTGSAAPSWFTKMDRNGDGDLSPKEFLGRRALFNTIDLNHDGLISSDEALAAQRDAENKP